MNRNVEEYKKLYEQYVFMQKQADELKEKAKQVLIGKNIYGFRINEQLQKRKNRENTKSIYARKRVPGEKYKIANVFIPSENISSIEEICESVKSAIDRHNMPVDLLDKGVLV